MLSRSLAQHRCSKDVFDSLKSIPLQKDGFKLNDGYDPGEVNAGVAGGAGRGPMKALDALLTAPQHLQVLGAVGRHCLLEMKNALPWGLVSTVQGWGAQRRKGKATWG